MRTQKLIHIIVISMFFIALLSGCDKNAVSEPVQTPRPMPKYDYFCSVSSTSYTANFYVFDNEEHLVTKFVTVEKRHSSAPLKVEQIATYSFTGSIFDEFSWDFDEYVKIKCRYAIEDGKEYIYMTYGAFGETRKYPIRSDVSIPKQLLETAFEGKTPKQINAYFLPVQIGK